MHYLLQKPLQVWYWLIVLPHITRLEVCCESCSKLDIITCAPHDWVQAMMPTLVAVLAACIPIQMVWLQGANVVYLLSFRWLAIWPRLLPEWMSSASEQSQLVFQPTLGTCTVALLDMAAHPSRHQASGGRLLKIHQIDDLYLIRSPSMSWRLSTARTL